MSVDQVTLLSADSAGGSVAAGRLVSGATESGPTRLGQNMHVCGRSELPDGLSIVGSRYQVASKMLGPGETYQGEPGTMFHMSDGMKQRARFAGWRVFTGEGLAKIQFTNHGAGPGYLGLTPNMPMALVVPFDVSSYGTLNCKRGAFMAGDESVKVMPKILPARSAAACCCGGMPPIIQELSGTGTALLNAGGTVMMKQLAPGEKLLVDTHSVVAFSNTVGYDVRQVGDFATCCLGGEGCFNTELTGPGTIYLQTLSWEKLIKMLLRGGGGGKKKNAEGNAAGALIGALGGGAPLAGEEMER